MILLQLEDSALVLSPFLVNSGRDTGYQALNTLAGTRLNTPIEDIGAAVSIYTTDFITDIGATDINEMLVYATGMEASGSQAKQNSKIAATSAHLKYRGASHLSLVFQLMNTRSSFSALLLGLAAFVLAPHAHSAIPGVKMPPADGKLRIIAFGAHPDDCEIQVGGSAARWAKLGHHVLFVSTTNGDIGHWREAGGPLAQRRKAEVDKAHEILGIQGVVLDNHDGELEPTLENRRALTRLIREWNADLVLGPRTNDYHPDHRYTGVLVQDAAYMVTVPFFCPDVPAMKKNPVFMYYTDRFQKPAPSKPDIVISIDPVIEKKLDALGVMISQFAEGGANGNASLYPDNPAGQEQRKRQVRDNFSRRFQGTVARFNKELKAWYPGDAANSVKHAEAFEVCEYGSQPDKSELRRLFPFFD